MSGKPFALTALIALAALTLLPPAPVAALPDGDLDTSFGDDGSALWQLVFLGFQQPPTRVEALAAADREIFAVGRRGGNGDEHMAFAGYDVAGQEVEDHACDDETSQTFAFGVESEALAGVVTESGDLLVGGSLTIQGSESTRRALVARFDLDQTGCELDTDFGANGWRIFDTVAPCTTASCQVTALAQIRPATGAVSATRTILLVRSVVSLVESRFYLYAVDDDGDLDTGFDGNGLREVTLPGSDGWSTAGEMAIDARGRIYFLANAYDADAPSLDRDLYLLRFLPNGALDTTFSGDGIYPIAVDDEVDEVPDDLAIASDGSLLASFHPAAGGAPTLFSLRSSGASLLVMLPFLKPSQLACQGNGGLLGVNEFNEASAADGFRAHRWTYDGILLDLDPTWSGDGMITQDYDFETGEHEADSPVELLIWNGRPVVAGIAESSVDDVSYLLRLENAHIFADGFEQGTVALWSKGVP
jgi:hypothetical protein